MLQVVRMVTLIELLILSGQQKPGTARPVNCEARQTYTGKRCTDINALVAKHVNKRKLPLPCASYCVP